MHHHTLIKSPMLPYWTRNLSKLRSYQWPSPWALRQSLWLSHSAAIAQSSPVNCPSPGPNSQQLWQSILDGLVQNYPSPALAIAWASSNGMWQPGRLYLHLSNAKLSSPLQINIHCCTDNLICARRTLRVTPQRRFLNHQPYMIAWYRF